MAVLDGRRESCSCSAVTAVCLCKEVLLQPRQTAVAGDLESQQLLLFVFARRSVWQYSMAEENPAAQRQTAVTSYL